MKHLIVIVTLSFLVAAARTSSLVSDFYTENNEHQTFFQFVRRVLFENEQEPMRAVRDVLLTQLRNLPDHVIQKQFLTEIDTMNVLNETERCDVCQAVVRLIKRLRLNGLPPIGIPPQADIVIGAVTNICRTLATVYDILNINSGVRTQKDKLCNATMAIQVPEVLAVVGHNASDPATVASAAEFCESLNLCFPPETASSDDSFTLHDVEIAPSSQSTGGLTEKNRLSQTGVIKVVQLTDIHIEPDYQRGRPTDCGLPVCCVEDIGKGFAGPYGDHQCNIPQTTIEHFLEKVKTMDPDVVLFTGDVPPHTMWEESEQSQTRCTELLTESIKKNLSDHAVYPTIGNHETYPTNQFSTFKKPATGNFLLSFYHLWQPIANFTEEHNETIAAGGYYTMLIRKGLRVLAFNSNYMYSFNWYNALNYKNTEVIAMKAFMENTLAEARNNSEKVILLGHHPVGDSDFIISFSRWYQSLVRRFSDVIVLQPTGHTHSDGFRLVYDSSGRPVSVVYISPSMTTVDTVNPSMRVFHLDETTYEVIDYEQHFFNLSSIRPLPPNQEPPPPTIQLLYSAKSAYSLPDLSPQSWHDFTVRLETDQDLLNTFVRHMDANAQSSYRCDARCKGELLCHLRNADFDKYNRCAEEFRSIPRLPTLPSTRAPGISTPPPSSGSGSVSVVRTASGFLQLCVLLLALVALYY